MPAAVERQQRTSGIPTYSLKRKPARMGRNNVDKLLLSGRPADIPWASWHCLMLMARTASDTEQRYWAGHHWLVMKMGYDPFNDTGFREVRRHIRLLEKHGYVAKVGGNVGGRTVYQLHLPGLSTGQQS
jgi:hypothetical protein